MNALRLHRYWQLMHYFGPKWLMYRGYQAARLKSGLVRWQLPATQWSDQPLSRFLRDPVLADPVRYANYRAEKSGQFFFNVSDLEKARSLSNWDTSTASPITASDDLANGIAKFFSHEQVDVGSPPDWHVDPFKKTSFPTDRHWSQIGDFSAGDIKLVWETNRFGFVFALVRSYGRTGNQKYAEQFWQLIENWQAENQPEFGANWKCGQEIALRAMAWCFGLYAFQGCTASTPERQSMLAQMLAVSARRIESNIEYALSQQNNHGLSEAMGLWTIGSLFPEFRNSAQWAARGRKLLESQALKLIYNDGAFSQHSLNYHRVMLHVYLWCLRLAECIDRPFSNRLRDRVAKAGDFLYEHQDDMTGFAPCYGQNDGALILPLNNCDYRDYRPVVQAIHFLSTGRRRFERGPWDEDLCWLFGQYSVDADPKSTNRPSSESTTEIPPSTRDDFQSAESGYVVLRSRHGFVSSRAASFRHRPGQADMLHADVWWRGQNIAVDAGTYSYNAPAPWDNSLSRTCCHNTVVVDGKSQMDQVSRFLWLPWLNGHSFPMNGTAQSARSFWCGQHDGYCRLPDPTMHRRGIVRLDDESWLVVDSLHSIQNHSYRLHWLLLDVPYELDAVHRSLTLQTTSGPYRVALSTNASAAKLEIERAATNSNRGWRSEFYHSREPAISVSLDADSTGIVFATVFGPDATAAVIDQGRIVVHGAKSATTVHLDLERTRDLPLITQVE